MCVCVCVFVCVCTSELPSNWQERKRLREEEQLKQEAAQGKDGTHYTPRLNTILTKLDTVYTEQLKQDAAQGKDGELTHTHTHTRTHTHTHTHIFVNQEAEAGQGKGGEPSSIS